jgi:hypothetical protein
MFGGESEVLKINRMKKKIIEYTGIFLGATYGVSYRLLCGHKRFDDIYDGYNIYSISFIWILPIVISLIPILFAKKEILDTKWKQFLFPLASVLMFFLFTLSSGIEDWLCILIISFPFLISAGIIGLLVAPIILKRNSNKLYSILFLPLILSPVESYLPNHKEIFEVKTKIEIKTKQDLVWNNLIEVPKIKNEEFDKGIYNYIGVPRPVKSKLEVVNGQRYRIGYFTDGLRLYETISEIDSLNFVEFKIHIDKSELRDLPTDNHLLKSNYFHFNKISYQVIRLNDNNTELILSCEYSLNSKMNGYANFWAKRIIKDFEERLLTALKLKIEKQTPVIYIAH